MFGIGLVEWVLLAISLVILVGVVIGVGMAIYAIVRMAIRDETRENPPDR